MTKILDNGQLEWILEATSQELEVKLNELYETHSQLLKASKKVYEVSYEIAVITEELSKRARGGHLNG